MGANMQFLHSVGWLPNFNSVILLRYLPCRAFSISASVFLPIFATHLFHSIVFYSISLHHCSSSHKLSHSVTSENVDISISRTVSDNKLYWRFSTCQSQMWATSRSLGWTSHDKRHNRRRMLLKSVRGKNSPFLPFPPFSYTSPSQHLPFYASHSLLSPPISPPLKHLQFTPFWSRLRSLSSETILFAWSFCITFRCCQERRH